MPSKKKPENEIDFQERVRYYIKQGKNRLTAIDLTLGDMENEHRVKDKAFNNNPRLANDKKPRK